MGHRRRRPARRLRAGQVPRRHLAHDGHSPPGRGSGTDERSGAPHEGAAGRRRHNEPGPSPTPGRRRSLYNTSPFRLRDLTSRGRQQQLRADFEAYLDGFSPNVQEVLEKFKFPQPDADARGGRCVGFSFGEVPGRLRQPQPQARPERGWLSAAGGARQPRDGHGLRGAHPALQRGEQRGGRRALHPARRRTAHGAPRLHAGRRRCPVRHLSRLRRRLRDRRDADGRRRDAE